MLVVYGRRVLELYKEKHGVIAEVVVKTAPIESVKSGRIIRQWRMIISK